MKLPLSGFRGVEVHRTRFRARTKIAGRKKNLGAFQSAIEAAVAYDTFIRKRFPDRLTNRKLGLLP